MTTNNEAFEKWYKNSTNLLAHGAPVYHSLKDAWQAATTEANKRIAELTQDRNDLNYLCMERLHKIEELQASNNRLINGISEIAAEAQDTYTNAALTKLLSATPAESLQAHDDELLERAAKICQRKSDDYKSLAISCDEIKDHVGHDICIHKQAVASSIANAIRSLKEVK